MNAKPKILLVVGEAARRDLIAKAAPKNTVILDAKNCEEGRAAIRRHADIPVIVSDLTLSDGSWWCMYHEMVEKRPSAELVVLMPRRGLDVSEIQAHGVTVLDGAPLVREEVARALDDALLRRQGAASYARI